MSDAIKELRDYLAKSPSVIYPEDVLAYLPAIEAENAKLRELVRDYDKMLELALADYRGFDAPLSDATHITLRMRMYEMGIEVE